MDIHNNDKEMLTQDNEETKGKLKLFLGYAPGVGKTYAMLGEASRRKKRGKNVVAGYIEFHNRPETLEQLGTIPVIPRKKITIGDRIYEEADIEHIIALHPDLVLIDELAHTNAPGSKNEYRYQDVLELINAGISVYTTMNIEHVESLNDVIEQITGVIVEETIPDSIIDLVDEIVIVDLTPDALRNRLQRGQIYKPEMIDNALQNFFRKGNLTALRELTLRQIADDVDDDLQVYMREKNIKENWSVNERIMVAISAHPASKALIRRGARMAKRLKCELYVVNVEAKHIFEPKPDEKQLEQLHNYQCLANRLGAKTVTLKGRSIASELADFAIEKQISKLIIGHSNRTNWQNIIRGSIATQLLKVLKNTEIIFVPSKYE